MQLNARQDNLNIKRGNQIQENVSYLKSNPKHRSRKESGRKTLAMKRWKMSILTADSEQ